MGEIPKNIDTESCDSLAGGGVGWSFVEQNTTITQLVIERTKILESFPEAWKYKTHQLNTLVCADSVSVKNIRHLTLE